LVSATSVQASSSERHLETASSKEIPQTYNLGVDVGEGEVVIPTHLSSGIAKHVCSEKQPSPLGQAVLMTQLAAASS
jgi:hypothetical protein